MDGCYNRLCTQRLLASRRIFPQQTVAKTNYLMKQLLIFVLAAATIVSCKKEKSIESSNNLGGGTGGGTTNGYFIKAKVNGVDRTFNSNEEAVVTDLGGGAQTLSLIGSVSATSVESINLTISFLKSAPGVGTFSEDAQTLDYITAGIYNPNSPTVVYTAGLATSSVSPLSITITKIDSTVAEGTFKGAFYKTDVSSGGPTSEYITFTDGSFKLPVK